MLKINCTCDDSERTIKNVYVFVNGEKYSGHRVVLNQNRWHHILSRITLKLDPYFGKVEKLYSTSSGLTVSSFTDLKNNATYVASNKTRRISNIKGGYTLNTEPTQEYFEHYLSSQLQRVNKNKKLLYVRRDLLVIYIFRNGECGQSFKIVLTSEDLSSWSQILSYIALIIDVPERCIKSLFSLNGNKICGPWELQHGASYVAVGYHQTFRKGCYHVDQQSTEVITVGYPVVPRDKNLICTHKRKRKMTQNLRWNHYEEYTCANGTTNRGSRRSSSSKKTNHADSPDSPDYPDYPDSSDYPDHPDSPDLENMKSRNMKPQNMNSENMNSKNSTNTNLDKNKKVTVHMRIKNSEASNVTITRNSGDSSPRNKKKKKWEEEDSSESETDTENNTNDGLCDCSTKSCLPPKQHHRHENKYHSEPASPGSSETELPTNRDKKERSEKNLTWKHTKKSESQSSIDKTEKVSVHIRGGKAVIIGGSSDEKIKKKSKISDILEKDSKKKSTTKQNKSKKNCATSCDDQDECRFYKISKPSMDKYKHLYCPFTSSNSKPKAKHYNTILKHRDVSESRLKNKNYSIECKEAAKCQASQKRKTMVKKLSRFLFDSSSSFDSLKGRYPERNEISDSTAENSSEEEYVHEYLKQHTSSCNICRIQQNRHHILKKKK